MSVNFECGDEDEGLPWQHENSQSENQCQSVSRDDNDQQDNHSNLMETYSHQLEQIEQNYNAQHIQTGSSRRASELEQTHSRQSTKLKEQAAQIARLDQLLFYYKRECYKLMEQSQQEQLNMKCKNCQEISRKCVELEEIIVQLRAVVKTKQEQNEGYKASLIRQCQKLSQLTQQQSDGGQKKKNQLLLMQLKLVERRMNEKEQLIYEKQKIICELARRNDKVAKINKIIRQDIRLSEQKLVALESQLHARVLQQYNADVNRFKENIRCGDNYRRREHTQPDILVSEQSEQQNMGWQSQSQKKNGSHRGRFSLKSVKDRRHPCSSYLIRPT